MKRAIRPVLIWISAAAVILVIGVYLLADSLIKSETSAREEYQIAVYEILRGEPLRDTGLVQIIDITLGDLGCSGELCTEPFRFQFLRDEVLPRKAIIADYRGRICKKEFKVPSAFEKDQQIICTELQNLFKALDAIQLNSSQAMNMLQASGGNNQEIQELLIELSKRMAKEEAKIIEVRARIKAITFLEPLFPKVSH